MVDKAKVTPSRSSARVAGSWQEISPRGTEQQLNGLRKQMISPKCNTALAPQLTNYRAEKPKGKIMETEELDLIQLTDSEVLAMLVAEMESLGLIKFAATTARKPDAIKPQGLALIQEGKAISKAA